jgi:long-chain acyl-CoA synthetase
VFAMTVTTCPNPREIAAFLPAVHPTWFFAVPRIWEKLMSGLQTFLTSGENAERNRAWLEAGARKVELEQAGEVVPEDIAATVAEAEAGLFAGLRAMLGLDELVAVNVGAAPTPRQVLMFFHAIGIPVAELWGMSETCGAGTCNPPDRVKLGTVGPPGPGIEVRLADDGELLVRSDVVMAGYRNQPERTAKAIDADGWLHTGDIARIDADGQLRIVGRKKELIINSSGKNMSPNNIEACLKESGPLIAEACVFGNGRPYNVALIVPEAELMTGYHSDEELRVAVQACVDRANARLSRVEQIKRFAILPDQWAPNSDELTPTMKLKRGPIERKYAAHIEALYEGKDTP